MGAKRQVAADRDKVCKEYVSHVNHLRRGCRERTNGLRDATVAGLLVTYLSFDERGATAVPSKPFCLLLAG